MQAGNARGRVLGWNFNPSHAGGIWGSRALLMEAMHPEPVKLRPLVESDYSNVIALWRRCEWIEIAEGDDEATFRAYLVRNPGLSLCAEIGGQIVGAALCGHDGRRGLIYHLGVSPEHRGMGIGKAIVQGGLSGLRKLGIERAIILVSRGNDSGRSFWVSLGFEEIDRADALGIDL